MIPRPKTLTSSSGTSLLIYSMHEQDKTGPTWSSSPKEKMHKKGKSLFFGQTSKVNVQESFHFEKKRLTRNKYSLHPGQEPTMFSDLDRSPLLISKLSTALGVRSQSYLVYLYPSTRVNSTRFIHFFWYYTCNKV